MAVGAAEAERVDAEEQGIVLLGKRNGFIDNLELPAGEVDLGVRRFEMQVRRNDAMLEGEQQLDEARHARARLEMTDVRLDRTDEAAPVFAGRTENAPDGLALDGIADRGARTVGLRHRTRRPRWIPALP